LAAELAMDSGLARFAVLIVLFFLLTGDLAGMVKHMFEEAGYGGKQHSHQRNRQQSPATSEDEGNARSAKAATAAGPEELGGGRSDGRDEEPDEDIEALGESDLQSKR